MLIDSFVLAMSITCFEKRFFRGRCEVSQSPISVSLFLYVCLLACGLSQQVSAVADGPRDADLCTLKSYQLLHETKTDTDAMCDVACYDERTDAQA